VNDNNLVSCVCVTRNRVPQLRRAVACFLAQTYPCRELVMVYESDDRATRDYFLSLKEPSIRAIEVAVDPKKPLGSLRNISIEASRGHYLAQWDDDDWYAPNRLAEQIGALRNSGKVGCVLVRWLMYDETTGTAFVSQRRTWEGSLVALRAAMPAYPELAKGEDTLLIGDLLKQDLLVGLDRPELYVYVYHGRNTWEREHWDSRLAQFAQPLEMEQTKLVEQRLYGPGGRPAQAQWMPPVGE
jgi:glycosyltransferase involved in cell wall biosynthesis